MAHEGMTWADVLHALIAVLDRRATQGWLVGGSLRDALLGMQPRDLDVVVADEAQSVVEALPGALRRGVGRLRHDTVRLAVGGAPHLHLDLSSLRGDTIAADLAARDFTVNAMALPLARVPALLSVLQLGRPSEEVLAALVDPLGGLQDVRQRRLRLATPAAFVADPGRIVRAARFLAGLKLVPTPELESDAGEAAYRLTALSAERLREELHGLLASPNAAAGFDWLRRIGTLAMLVPPPAPPVETDGPALDHELLLVATLAALEPLRPGNESAAQSATALAPLVNLLELREWYAQPVSGEFPRYVALLWGILTYLASGGASHDSSHREGSRLAKVRPGGAIGAVASVVLRRAEAARQLLAGGAPPLPAARRFFAELPGREALGVDALVAAAALAAGEASLRSAPAAVVPVVLRATDLLADYFRRPERYVPPPLIYGADLARELPGLQGAAFGRVLRTLRFAQLDERVATRDEVLRLARELVRSDITGPGASPETGP